MAAEFAPLGVRTNAISPGEIDTAILSPGTAAFADREVPMRRLGKPKEVAAAIYFLCSEAASYVNGTELHINGGQHV
jgi:NAD(P)-dependent dehydrogenase (short-subunit alcohol dehydrogenase family)